MRLRHYRLRALELARNDIIRFDDRCMRVLDEPETIHRGLGLFDEFQLLVGVRCVDAARPSAREYLVLDPEETVTVRRAAADPAYAVDPNGHADHR